MDKQNVVYAHYGILFSHEKKRSTDTHYNIDKSLKHHAEWKKSDTKGHTVYDSIYMKCLEQANPEKQKGD